MKKLVVAGCLLWATALQAQNDAVTNAFMANKDGEFDKAKEEIDKASVHEKTKDKAKTWYFRGMIYENIITSPNPKFKSMATLEASKATAESYNKAMSLSKKGDEYYDQSASKLNNLYGIFLNNGIANYSAGVKKQDDAKILADEKKDAAAKVKSDSARYLFDAAIPSYETAQIFSPLDTTACKYALYAAEGLKDYEKCKVYSRRLISLGISRPDLYLSLSRQARLAEKKDSALAHVQQGRIPYPNDKNLMLEELDLYFALGKSNEAKAKLEDAVKLDSTNANLYSILGNLYDQEAADPKRAQKDRDASKQKALANYRRALKFNSQNMESNFNLGVFHFNKGAEIRKKVDGMDINTYNLKGKKMEAEANAEFKNALPYFEKCYQIEPKDESAKKSLAQVYELLGRSADAEKVR